MSKKYTNYSKMVKETIPETVAESEINENLEDSYELEPDNKAKDIYGMVTECKKLNIRIEPDINSKVVCTVDCGSRLIISDDESTNDWYKVCVENGAEGYCMKKFVKVQA